MSITIDEINEPDRFASKHWVHFKVGGDKEVIQITGVCSLPQIIADEPLADQWQQETVQMVIRMPVEPLNGSFFLVESVAPLVTTSAVTNDHRSNDSGWGVDRIECRIEDAVLELGEVFPITVRLVLRERGPWSITLAYSATLLCSTLDERPPVEV